MRIVTFEDVTMIWRCSRYQKTAVKTDLESENSEDSILGENAVFMWRKINDSYDRNIDGRVDIITASDFHIVT